MSRHWSRTPRWKKPSKYGAIAAHIDGHRFASQAEARRYVFLRAEYQSGKIRALTCQVRFPLRVSGQLVTTYIADFTYFTVPDGTFVVEDVKGYRAGVAYGMFRLKAKLLHALSGLRVTEIVR